MKATKDLKFSVSYAVPPKIIYHALINADYVSKYTRCLAEIKPEQGSEFSLYDGYISGKILELKQDKKIVEEWKLKLWKDFSLVTIKIKKWDVNLFIMSKNSLGWV